MNNSTYYSPPTAMEKLAILTIGDGNFEQGFDRITLALYEDGEITQPPSYRFSGQLPPSAIPQLYQQWQEQYDELTGVSRGSLETAPSTVWKKYFPWLRQSEISRSFKKKGQRTHLSISEDSRQISLHLHQWLEPITRQLSQRLQLTPPDEIRLIVQTHQVTDEKTQKHLHQLPWHEWKLARNCPTEAAICFIPLNAQKLPNKEENEDRQRLKRVKVLGILGDSKDLDLETDRQIVQTLRGKGGSYSFLDCPKTADLATIWDKRWDIICFSGHSKSAENAQTGFLFINHQETLDITELRNALTTARNQGLKLVIFNSCDGLGLAKAIADLNIPYTIVWREPVPDLVAQRFLSHLLQSFTTGKSLNQSMREAREKLQLEGVEKQYPGVTRLPVICQNSATESLTWNGLRGRTGGRIAGGSWSKASQTSAEDYKFRQILLNKVRNYWVKGVLEKSLHNQVLIQLGLEQRIDAVDYPWRMAWETPNSVRQPHLLPVGTRAIDQFDELGKGRTMLILGEPGSGKTITLLELARDLIADAEEDVTLPMPVVFNLSTWGSKKQTKTFTDWLVQEFEIGYQTSKALAKKWIKNQQLLLLLDGLDEVKPEKREFCLNAINQFSQEYGNTEIVACCRIKDYNAIPKKLMFQGAIYLQPLTQPQIDRYLNQAGKGLSAVRRLLLEDEAMQELSTTPLMLDIMSFAYRGMSIEELQRMQSIEERRKHLFDAYIQRMFERRQSNQEYLTKSSLRWLVWLAKNMIQSSKTLFYIEDMQPSWLSSKMAKILYLQLFMGLFLSNFTMLSGLGYSAGEILIANHISQTTVFDVISAFLGTFVCGLFYGIGAALTCDIDGLDPLSLMTINLYSRMYLSFKRIKQAFFSPTFATMPVFIFKANLISPFQVSLFAFSIIFIFILLQLMLILIFVSSSLASSILNSLLALVIVALLMMINFVFCMTSMLALDFLEVKIESFTTSSEKVFQTIKNIGSISLLLLAPSLLFALSVKLFFGNDFAGSFFGLGIVLTILMTMVYSSSLIKHISLRFILYCSSLTPWNYSRFLNYASERIFLKKVGSGYIFIHRLLMEHFASMEMPNKAR